MKTISFFIFLLYNYLGDNMKKAFLAVIVFILILFIIDINKFNNKLYKKIEQEIKQNPESNTKLIVESVKKIILSKKG